tara:strand:+ start:5026 stop:5127 length:102 start_codon:yes stop_codon:yes gene_type:complete
LNFFYVFFFSKSWKRKENLEKEKKGKKRKEEKG